MNCVIIPALLGPLLGPFTGGLIVHFTSWRVIFFVNIPFAFVGLWLIRRHMPDYRDARVAPLDRFGFVTFSAGIAFVSYVLEIFGEHTHAVTPLTAMALAAIALLAT